MAERTSIGDAMQGLMQTWPLTVDKFLDHAKAWHGHREIVSRSVEGPIVRTTYAEAHDRAKRMSNALAGLGVKTGDRVATLAWNIGTTGSTTSVMDRAITSFCSVISVCR